MSDNTYNRRRSDIELAVLTSKMDSLTEHVTKHMDNEEKDRKEIWKEIRKLDKKFIVFALPLLSLSGAGGMTDIVKNLF